MPVIAVAGAVAGATSLATIGAAGLGVFGTVSAIGGIVAGIGALTGSKDLMRIGAIAGLAGGVGAFAQGKGWLSPGFSEAAGATEPVSNIQAMTQTAAPGMEAMGAATEPVSGLFDAASVAGETAGMPAAVEGGIQQGITGSNPLVSEPGNLAGPSLSKAQLDMTNGVANPAPGAFDLAQTPSKGIMDYLKDFSDWTKNNKELASMAGNFIGGMFDEEKEARAEFYRTRSDLEKRQAENASAVPKMGFRTKQTGPVFKSSSPTYNAPKAGLFYAR